MTQNDEILSNGVFGSKSGTQLMNVWKTFLTKRLDVTKGVIGWSEIGNDLLQFLYMNHKNLYENYTIYNGLETMYPVNWNRCVHEFLLKPYDNYKNITKSFQPIIILVNSVYKHFESMDNTDCTPLMYFIQKSLQSKELYKTELKKHILSSEETMTGKELFQEDIDVFSEKSLLSNLNNCLKTVLLEKNYKPVLLGNLCYDHEQYDPPFYDSPLLKDCEEKRNRIMKASKSSNCVFEIGLNGGHSSLLMLESNPKLKIVANDIAEFYPPCPNIHPEVYVPAAAEFLTNNFKDRFTFVKGSCLKKVPEYVSTHKTTFDMVHIDGAKETYQQDFYNLAPSLSQHALVVFDDSNIPHVQNMVNNLLKEGFVSRTEEFPHMNTTIKYRNEILRFEKNKYVFSQIYKNSTWNNKNPNIPLSGPGSSMEQTKKCRNMLESFVTNYGIMTITDLGCGDLTWMSQCNFFSKINYIGIDAATQIISQHKEKYDKTFLCEDITSYQIQQTDLIILRDVVFHLSIEEVQNIFRNIKDKFKFIAVTSCNNAENTNIFDQWKFSQRNLHIDPFCVKGFPLYSVNEDDFNRKFYIYDHDSFYGSS